MCLDAEKQDAMNLFLGNYRVRKGVGPAIWELPSDYHLHNIMDPELKKIRKSYTRWWTPEALLPQDVLARKSFLYAQEHDLDRFQLHDAGYDGIDGPLLDDFENEGLFAEQRLDRGDDDNTNMNGTRADKPIDSADSAHLEKVRSEDADEISGGTSEVAATTHRMDGMDSTMSGQASTGGDKRPSRVSPVNSFSRTREEEGQSSTQLQVESKMRTSLSNTSISSSSRPENGLDNGESSFEGSLPERVGALSNAHLDDSSRSSIKVMSSSSSVSSMHQYFQQHKLRTSTSRSSLKAASISSSNNTIQPKSSAPHFSRGEQYAYDGLHGCDDDDAVGECGSRSAVWEEYWEEYYRPKVRTSFKTLFAFEMHSTSRYIPPK